MSSKSQRTTVDSRDSSDGYVTRWYESGDEERILSLFEDQLGRMRSKEYFEWKYLGDPYLSHVPITVAERDGELVGVQAYIPFEFRDADRTRLALQPADAVVHEDHRRNGLYTRMTRQAIERYSNDDDASLFFNYPSPGALEAQQQLGWQSVETLDVRYRIRRPSSFLQSRRDGGVGESLLGVADTISRGAYGLVDSLAPSAEDVTVTSYRALPAQTLATLYQTYVPDRLHVHREKRFYEWWLTNPALDYTTYVAQSSGRPVAALVTRLLPGGVLQLREAVPLAPYQPNQLFGRLLLEVFADNPDAKIVKSVGSTLPADLLTRFGFVRDSTPLIGRRTTPLHLAVRPLMDPSNDALLEALTDAEQWCPTFVEVDRD